MNKCLIGKLLELFCLFKKFNKEVMSLCASNNNDIKFIKKVKITLLVWKNNKNVIIEKNKKIRSTLYY